MKYTAFGETKRVPDWVKDCRCVVGNTTLRKRLATTRGDWTVERALTEPARRTGVLVERTEPDVAAVCRVLRGAW